MPKSTVESRTVRVRGLSNQEFFERYAQPGRIGLTSGDALVDKAICRAQRRLHGDASLGGWSHAFLFQGTRHDGHQWIIESNMQVHRKHYQFGVQENRVSKFFNEKSYSNVAVLDFDLTEDEVRCLLKEGLELVAARVRYSVRELFGTLIALRHPGLRGKDNLLSRDRSFFCSAFVNHLFKKAGLELAPGVHGKNTTPDDIALTALPHTAYVRERLRT